MKPEHFKDSTAGTVVLDPAGYAAFVPAPMPPKIAYTEELVLALSWADTALSELSGLGRHLPNPHLLITPYIRREAILSSRIEGTQASLSDLLLDEIEGTRQKPFDELREIRNYMVALEHGINRLRDQMPLKLQLVREIHERLMSGVRGDRALPGRFRRVQNWIGVGDSSPRSAEYVPPPPDEMLAALLNWEEFVALRNTMPDLIQCALMHAHFETIHPFLDGNGRVGRLLIPLFLLERGRLSQPLLYMSAYLEAHHKEYDDLLQRTRTDGDWETWIQFFLVGVAETAQAAVRQAGQLMDLRENYRKRLIDKSKALGLLDALFVNPYATVAGAANILGVSGETARQTILLLQRHGVLEEVTGRERDRIYLAKPILAAIEPIEDYA